MAHFQHDLAVSDNETLCKPPFTTRFWSKVHKTETCWLWTGAVSGGGGLKHGQVLARGYRRTPQKAHRIAWILTHGPIPDGKQINHHCDVPTCVNPDHLYIGTQLDNMRDAVARHRFPLTRKPRKLPDECVRAIRVLADGGVRHVLIARAFDVTAAAISQIVNSVRRIHVS